MLFCPAKIGYPMYSNYICRSFAGRTAPMKQVRAAGWSNDSSNYVISAGSDALACADL